MYGVGKTDNVVLYRENLRDDDGNGAPSGIQGDEVVPEQAGVHEVWKVGNRPSGVAAASGTDIDGDNWVEQSNLHIGELHWGSPPTDQSQYPDTTLGVEVDYLEGRNPFNVQRNGISVPEAVQRNYRLYGIDVRFHEDEELTISQLKNKCKMQKDTENYLCNLAPDYYSGPKISPLEVNRHEMDKIEDYFHDDQRRMHLFWGSELGRDSPKSAVDLALMVQGFDLSNAGAMTFTNGAPGTELWRTVSDNDFGMVVGHDTQPGFDDYQSLTMHELGHALGIGYADDDTIGVYGIGIQNGLEVYSGDVNGRFLGPDETPEIVTRNGDPRWSIMMAGRATNYSKSGTSLSRFAFSIEELSTVDMDHIPSKTGS